MTIEEIVGIVPLKTIIKGKSEQDKQIWTIELSSTINLQTLQILQALEIRAILKEEVLLWHYEESSKTGDEETR